MRMNAGHVMCLGIDRDWHVREYRKSECYTSYDFNFFFSTVRDSKSSIGCVLFNVIEMKTKKEVG